MSAVPVDPAELAELRRRAYGPGGGIDAAALLRLEELEELLREERMARLAAADAARAAADDVRAIAGPSAGATEGADADAVPGPRPAAGDPQPGVQPQGRWARWFALPKRSSESVPDMYWAEVGRGWKVAGVVAVAAVLAVAGTLDSVHRAAPPPAAAGASAAPAASDAPSSAGRTVDDERRGPRVSVPGLTAPQPTYPEYLTRPGDAEPSLVLLRVPLDGSYGDVVDLHVAEDAPEFPSGSPLRWAQPLGQYFGWELWIARAEGDDACVLLLRGSLSQGVCAPSSAQPRGAVAVDIPFERIPATRRPGLMAEGQSIGFWWLGGSAVAIVLTEGP